MKLKLVLSAWLFAALNVNADVIESPNGMISVDFQIKMVCLHTRLIIRESQ